jgi:hypothetical protein
MQETSTRDSRFDRYFADLDLSDEIECAEAELREAEFFDEFNGMLRSQPSDDSDEFLRVANNRMRAEKLDLSHDLTVGQWLNIKGAFRGCCAYCGQPSRRIAMDHVVPICQGGGTTQNNVLPSCPTCNSSKGTRDPVEWLGAGPDTGPMWARIFGALAALEAAHA